MRERRPLRQSPRERAVFACVSLFYAGAMAVAGFALPWNRPLDLTVAISVVGLFGVMAGVTFAIGRGFATPDQLALVPVLYLVPLPLAAPLVALGYLLSEMRAVVRRQVHPDRLAHCFTNAHGALGAAVVIGLLGPHARGASAVAVYAAAAIGQWLAVAITQTVIYRVAYGAPLSVALRAMAFVFKIDALLWPFAMLVAVGADSFPLALAAPLPLAWLLVAFSRERNERHTAAIELNRAYRGTVAVLTDVVEAEDRYTAEHSRSVVSLAEAVADELRVPADDRQELEFAALLHDVGKLAIPREVLRKPSSLTEAEFELIKTHTIEGERILARAGGLLARVGATVRSCHERWDGRGYPDRLFGEQIPLAARIVFCCDAYNAMTTDRPYRRAMGRDVALLEIESNAGTQFDPTVAAALRAVVLRGGHDTEAVRADAVRAVLAGV
jgi:HD-GYP domain-containing protein (c-di-GMP phosphodiesterase class II)